jgi:hypothetical protein
MKLRFVDYLLLSFPVTVGLGFVVALVCLTMRFNRDPGMVVCTENGVEVFRAAGTLESSRDGRHIYTASGRLSPANTWTCQEIRP